MENVPINYEHHVSQVANIMLHIFVSSISFPTHRKNYFPLSLNFAEGCNSAGTNNVYQNICFAKFLNIWFVSRLSNVWEV